MGSIVNIVSDNIKRLRELKKLSQKEVALDVGIPQGQYSRIENGKVEPTISTLEKFAKVFEVSISELFKSNQIEEQLNLPLMEKIKMLDKLDDDEKEALFKIIDAMISKKILKDNLANLAAQ
jgi:transcriptional regulator with XRE-family HTH domain